MRVYSNIARRSSRRLPPARRAAVGAARTNACRATAANRIGIGSRWRRDHLSESRASAPHAAAHVACAVISGTARQSGFKRRRHEISHGKSRKHAAGKSGHLRAARARFWRIAGIINVAVCRRWHRHASGTVSRTRARIGANGSAIRRQCAERRVATIARLNAARARPSATTRTAACHFNDEIKSACRRCVSARAGRVGRDSRCGIDCRSRRRPHRSRAVRRENVTIRRGHRQTRPRSSIAQKNIASRCRRLPGATARRRYSAVHRKIAGAIADNGHTRRCRWRNFCKACRRVRVKQIADSVTCLSGAAESRAKARSV